MDEAVMVLTVVLPLIFLAGGVLVILMGMYQHTKTLEMKHRERLAMIERGLAPPPELDPAAFEYWQRRERNPPAKSTSIGVIVVALGLGLGLLIGFAGGAPEAAAGVGGAIVVLGAAFIINGELNRRSRPPIHLPQTESAQYPPPPPPTVNQQRVQPPPE